MPGVKAYYHTIDMDEKLHSCAGDEAGLCSVVYGDQMKMKLAFEASYKGHGR